MNHLNLSSKYILNILFALLSLFHEIPGPAFRYIPGTYKCIHQWRLPYKAEEITLRADNRFELLFEADSLYHFIKGRYSYDQTSSYDMLYGDSCGLVGLKYENEEVIHDRFIFYDKLYACLQPDGTIQLSCRDYDGNTNTYDTLIFSRIPEGKPKSILKRTPPTYHPAPEY